MSHDSNYTLEKGPFVYKFVQTNLANLLSCLTQWFAGFFFLKVVTSTDTCKCSISTTSQRMT